MEIIFFQAEDGIRDRGMWLEFRRVLFRSPDDPIADLIEKTPAEETPAEETPAEETPDRKSVV